VHTYFPLDRYIIMVFCCKNTAMHSEIDFVYFSLLNTNHRWSKWLNWVESIPGDDLGKHNQKGFRALASKLSSCSGGVFVRKPLQGTTYTWRDGYDGKTYEPISVRIITACYVYTYIGNVVFYILWFIINT